MQDFLFISFFLGHQAGKEARLLLAEYDLLEVAIRSPLNRHAWSTEIHFGVSLRLPIQDIRLNQLLERLRQDGVSVYTRLDREYTKQELDLAEWLMMRTATAGLLGGMDYGQTYNFTDACNICGSGAEPSPPLLAELGKMGKKDIDHLIYEGHFIVSNRLANAIKSAELTGIEFAPVKSPRNPVSERFSWLRVTSQLPPMDSSTTGYVKYNLCSSCGRAGHYGTGNSPEVPIYEAISLTAADFNATWEYFGDWQEVLSSTHKQPIGGKRGVVISKRARQVFLKLQIPRMVWIPVMVISPGNKPSL